MSNRNVVMFATIATVLWTYALTAVRAEDRDTLSVGVLHPLATNSDRPDVTSLVDLSVFYGRVGAIEGLQLGGLAGYAAREVRGVQLAGVAAITAGTARGVQLAGLSNIARAGLTGLQLSAALNLSSGATHGLQLSGATNIASDDMSGVQLAPLNIAGPVQGLQLGVVNIAKHVRGLQLGLINIADDVDGAAVGLISIARDSLHPIVWASNLQYMNAGVKFSTKYAFSLIGVHYGTRETDFDTVGLTLGLGGRLPLPMRFDLELQGSFTQLAPWRNQPEKKTSSWIAPQLAVGYTFAPHMRIFVGAGVRLPIDVELARSVTRPELLAGVQL